jgi:4-hydroxy-3-methylbut-2-enyl diphosphate reductase
MSLRNSDWRKWFVKVNVAKSAGFCFGVKRALKIALDTSKTGSKVEMLGDIVHNEDVVKEIKKAGVGKIRRLRKGGKKILLIRAHGASEEIYEKASNLDYTIVDATCPMVKEIHKIARNSKKEGCEVIIIGDKKHDEVRGIMGQLQDKAIVIDSIKKIPLTKLKKVKKACVVVQSTQNMDKTIPIVDILKKHIKDLKFFNTICRPTRVKQKEIKEMPLKNDLIIIIGSRTSANTKRLYQISKSINKRSYWIQSRDEIKKEWFSNAQSVGIMAGASTPDYTTKKVIKYIKSI